MSEERPSRFQQSTRLLSPLLREQRTPHAALAYPPTVSEGSTGSAVVRLQNDLDGAFGFPIVAIDGIFGPKTKNAVVEFQQQVNLTPDGVVGPHTWHALEPFTC